MIKQKWVPLGGKAVGSRLVFSDVMGDVRKLKKGWSYRIDGQKKRHRVKTQREARKAVEAGGLQTEVHYVASPAPSSQSRARSKMAKDQAVESLQSFAHRVQQAANECTPWTSGADRVFISDVYQRLKPRPPLEEFRKRLVEAHQADLLELARADLVEAMDPKKVRASELTHYGARFHFIVKTTR